MIKYYHSTTNVKEFLINFQLLTFHIQILLSVGEVLGGIRGGRQVVERNFLDGVRLLAADDAVNGEGEGLGLLGAVLGVLGVRGAVLLHLHLLLLLEVPHVADDGGAALQLGHRVRRGQLLQRRLVVVGGQGGGGGGVAGHRHVGGGRHWGGGRGRGHAGHGVQGGELRLQGLLLLLLQAEPLPPPQQGSVLEHGDGLGVEGPVGALAGTGGVAGDLDEAVVEAEVVAKGVLPAGRVGFVVGEPVHDELVDVGQGQHPLGGVVDGHGREGDVGVGRLGVAVTVAAWSGHAAAESHWCLHNSGANKQLENGRLAAAQLSCRGGPQVRHAAARAPLADTGSPGGRAAGAARAVTATQVIVTVYCSCPRPAPICSKNPSYLLYQTCGYTYTILIWTHGPAREQILSNIKINFYAFAFQLFCSAL